MCSKFEERNNEIIQELKDLGYANRKINYEEFLRIYEPYKEEMSEKDFALLLGIAETKFSHFKSGRHKTQVLTEKIDTNKIILELKDQGYANRKINYEEFLKIYDPYRTKMSERQFAIILGILESNFATMKSQGTKAIILKDNEEQKKLQQEIKDELKEKGYTNKKINYNEFLKLYERYKERLSEREFARILGINDGNFNNLKNKGTKAIILREKKDTNSIVDELKKQGYANRIIDYRELVELHRCYKEKFTITEFARILGIKKSTYGMLKKGLAKSIILKDIEYQREFNKALLEKLKREGYTNKKIDYEEFFRIYEPYKDYFSEIDFARLLGIKDGNFYDFRNKRRKTTILKEEKHKKIKGDIIAKLKEKGYANKKIDYQEFLELYEEYKGIISEKEFAVMIGIKEGSFYTFKKKGLRLTILNEETLLAEFKKNIVEELKRRGYSNKRIGYKKFLELYDSYKDKLSEIEFARVLGINDSNLYNLRRRKRTTIILKYDEKEKDDLSKKIIAELKERGYANKKIDYKEFLELYSKYKDKTSEKEFAKILGIKDAHYNRLKKGLTKAIILKEKNLIERFERKVIEELKKKGYENKLINYQEFLKIYEPYKNQISERNFARILGIYPNDIYKLREKGARVTILKDKFKKMEQDIGKKIVEELKKKDYQNKKIGYKEFLKIYEEYKEKLSEQDLATLLGISYGKYCSMKYKKEKGRINFNYERDKRIKYLFRKSQSYEIAYLEEVSKDFDISIEEILEIVGRKDYIDVLDTKGYVFLGKKRLSQDFINRHIVELSEKLHRYSKYIGRKLHTSSSAEDIAQEAILIIIEQEGEFEENYSEEKAIEKLKIYAFSIIKYKHLKLLRLNRVISLDENLSDGDKRTRYYRTKAKDKVEEEAEKREEQIEIAKGDTAVITIEQCLENGMDRDNALKFVMEKYKLSKEELLEILKNELLKRKGLKTAEDGRVYLAEKSKNSTNEDLDY